MDRSDPPSKELLEQPGISRNPKSQAHCLARRRRPPFRSIDERVAQRADCDLDHRWLSDRVTMVEASLG
jgi:hypothetical protein